MISITADDAQNRLLELIDETGLAQVPVQVVGRQRNAILIAEEDLKNRGPGDFFGSRQHGLPELKIADMLNDIDMLRLTRTLAKEIVSADPTLSQTQNRGLKAAVNELFDESGIHSFN